MKSRNSLYLLAGMTPFQHNCSTISADKIYDKLLPGLYTLQQIKLSVVREVAGSNLDIKRIITKYITLKIATDLSYSKSLKIVTRASMN